MRLGTLHNFSKSVSLLKLLQHGLSFPYRICVSTSDHASYNRSKSPFFAFFTVFSSDCDPQITQDKTERRHLIRIIIGEECQSNRKRHKFEIALSDKDGSFFIEICVTVP